MTAASTNRPESARAVPGRILLLNWGGYGDLHPYVALGKALLSRGHSVVLAANHEAEELAAKHELEFLPLQPRPRHSPSPAKRQPLLEKLAVARRYWFFEGFIRWRERCNSILHMMRRSFELIGEQDIPGRTVVVTRGTALGARIAREKLGVPMATLHLSPAMIRSEYEFPGLPFLRGASLPVRLGRRLVWWSIDQYVEILLTPELNRFRSEIGLPPVRRPLMNWQHSPDLVLALFPRWYAQPQPDWPPNTHQTGFPLFAGEDSPELPPKLKRFLDDGDPPVVFTRGSHLRGGRNFMEVAVDVCRRSGRRGLLLAPFAEAVPERLPDSVAHFSYVPLNIVLPRAAAIVHHGGIGTTALAFEAGIPQIIIPQTDDQGDNAARVERLGAGARVMLRRFNPATVARELDRLLSSEDTLHHCQCLAGQFHAADPIIQACERIEALISDAAEES
jgi:rhamnosyltransferase subunit B